MDMTPLIRESEFRWRLDPTGDGYYRLVNRHSGKVLDVAGGPGSLGDGVNVQQWDNNGQANQQWRFVPVR